jgi:hypothetical protein
MLADRCIVFSRIIKNVENVKINENKSLLDRHFNTESPESDIYIQDLKRYVQNNVEENQFYEFNVSTYFVYFD